MKVSIITATYNSERTILDTVNSINQQNYQDIEYIIVDGGSSDNTIDIIKKSCPRVSVLISEPDKGIYDALNKGISIAKGDVIGFLHSDDVFANSDVITLIVEGMLKNKANASYSDLEYVDKDNLNKTVRYWKSGKFSRSRLVYGWMPPHPTFFMERELYERLGLFNLNYKISADYDSMLRYLSHPQLKITYLPIITTKMRVGGISNRSLKTVIKKMKEDITVMKSNGLFWPVTLVTKNLIKIPQFIKRNHE